MILFDFKAPPESEQFQGPAQFAAAKTSSIRYRTASCRSVQKISSLHLLAPKVAIISGDFHPIQQHNLETFSEISFL